MQKRLTITTLLKFLCVLAGVGLVASPAFAYNTDPLIEGAKLCTKHLPRFERENGIPTHLLSAIASTESGRYHEGLGLKVPWPWTINVEGKGYFFDTKQAAIDAVKRYRARGIQSIDVGCMQVNLYHHPQAFASLEEAFEPQTNIAYAASFLHSLYQEAGSWRKAAGDYHSKTPALGAQYVSEVYGSWYGILQKLREAKMQVPDSTQLASNEAPAPYVRHIDSLVQDKPASGSRGLPEQRGQKLQQFHAPSMRVIQVGNDAHDASKENGITVVRPEMQAANASSVVPAVNVSAPVQLTAVQTKPGSFDTPEAKVVHVNGTSADGNSRKTGPTFIFND